MARLCPGRGTIAAALFITLLVLYCGVTEFVLWFVVTPWIRYAELWLRYFTLVYATVACIVALYLAKVLPGLQLTSDYFSCGKCATCIRTLRANCEEDVYPDPVHAGDHEQSGPGNISFLFTSALAGNFWGWFVRQSVNTFSSAFEYHEVTINTIMHAYTYYTP